MTRRRTLSNVSASDQVRMGDEVASIEAPDEQSRRQRREKLSAFYGNSQGKAPAMGIQEKNPYALRIC